VPQGEKQIALCRNANEYSAKVREQEPTRYGFFATVPSLLDPEAAHAEIIYALDVLKADGIVLYTRYGTGHQYLGNPAFKATWDLLDSRNAVVFVHPTSAADKGLSNPALPQPMIDYPHETTRTACDLITSGTIRDHPNVKIILSHGGGTLPYLALRPAAMLPYVPTKSGLAANLTAPEITEKFLEYARTFYFDSALSASPLQLQLLSQFAKPDHVFFGSDFPYAPTAAIKQMNGLLDAYAGTDAEFTTSLNYGAALKLFPRLREILEE
jgi:6-methylsalicylate decarboxylase